MPRFVRPAWIDVSADGNASRGTGPRSRDGYLSACLTLRTAAGSVSDTACLTAGGKWTDGSGRANLAIPRTFAVSIVDAAGAETVYAVGAVRSITLRPTDD